MQDKMMPHTAQSTFYYQVICRDFKWSNTESALLLYAWCSLGALGKVGKKSAPCFAELLQQLLLSTALDAV